nr:hypothetical protein [Tanacetum cinerariifolium]
IQQYLQNEHYALWEVIEFGDSYKAPPEEAGKGPASESSTKKKGRTVVITTEDMQKRRNDAKARTTLLLALPDEHQLRFSNIQVYTASTDVAAASLSHDTICAYIASQSNGSQIKYKDITQIDEDDIEEMDIKWNMALLSMRADRPTPGIDESKCNTSDLQSNNFSASKHGESSGSIMSKPMIKFVKAVDCPRVTKTNNTKNARKSTLKYAEIGVWVENGKIWPKNNYAHKNSYMANEEENHALVIDDEVPTKFALMAKSSLSSEKEVEARLVEFKEQEIKLCKKIRGLERDVEIRDNKIEYLINELKKVKKEKEGLDNKLTGFESASKDLDNLLGSQRLDKNKEGLGYNVVPPHAQVYSPSKKDFNFSISELEESSCSIMSKPMIKFVKAADCPRVTKTNNTENARKSTVKYPEITPVAISRPNMNVAQPKMTSFATTSHSNVKRPFQRRSAVKTQPKVPRVSNVTKNFPTVDLKFSTAKSTFTVDLGNKGKAVKASACWIWRPKPNTTEKGPNCNGVSMTFKKYQYIDTQGRLKSDSGFSRHMTGNLSYLSEYEPYDGGYVLFGQGGGKIIGKGIIKTGKLEFKNVYFVKELKYNLFSVSQIYDNKNSVLFTDSEWIVLGKDFKLKDDLNVLLRTPRQHNMYSIDLNNIVPHKNLICLVTKASVDESMMWHRRLGNSYVYNPNPNFFDCPPGVVAVIQSPATAPKTDAAVLFIWTFFLRTKDETSSILRNFITEIENLKDLKVKTIRCDNGGKFDAKGDEGYFVGYSMSSKSFRVFNKRTKKVEENLHVDFLENKLIEKGAGPNWLFDIDTLTNFMNCVPVVVVGTSSSNISGTKDVACQAVKKDVISNPTATSKVPSAEQVEPVVSLTVETEIPTVSSLVPTVCLDISFDSSSDPRIISKGDFSQKETPSLGNALTLSYSFEDTFREESDLSNMETSISVSPTPTFRIYKDHPKSQIIGPVDTHVQTRHKSKEIEQQSFIATIHQKTNHDLLQFCLFSCFLSQEEPKKIFDALKDPSWVKAMQEELI